MISTCTGAADYGTVIYYSHLVPVFISVILSAFTLIKSKFSFLSRVFSLFTLTFCLWLLGDLVTWVATDNYYDPISFAWAPLDYLNIVFYLLGAYFFAVLIQEKDITWRQKLFFVLLSLPGWWITFTNKSITDFNQATCENTNNELLSNYKLIVEIISVAFILLVAFYEYGKSTRAKKKQIIMVSSALLLFFGVFSITEYVSSQNGVYEITLYSLFVLPVFLLTIIVAINRFDMFDLKFWNQQLLAWILIPLIASEFFYLNGASDFILNLITLVISFVIVYLLNQNIKKETINRIKIESLNKELVETNDRLKEVDKQKTEFISVASHQLRGPLTAIKGYSSLILEGDFGEVTQPIKEAVETIFKSTQALVVIVGDYLDVSRIEQGRMRYDFSDFDLKALTETLINEFQPNIRISGLELKYEVEDGKDYFIHGDIGKIKQVIGNIVDNSIKYTPHGTITLSLGRNDHDKILIKVKDTGVGIPAEVLPKLFEKFTRAPGASNTNITGTGLGLYVVKKMMEAHRGRVWAESEGTEKGSTFNIEIDALHKSHTPINEKLEDRVEKFDSELEIGDKK